MQALRSAGFRFTNLQDYPFSANCLQIEDGESRTPQVHYLDEGRSKANSVGPIFIAT